MDKTFKSLNEAKQYKSKIKECGFRAYIEEFYNLDGRFFMVIVTK